MDSTTTASVTTLVTAVLSGGAVKVWFDRRDRAKTQRGIDDAAHVEAGTQLTKLNLASIEERFDDLRIQIKELRDENGSLRRSVTDLQTTLSRYQTGQMTPPGYALMPLQHLALVRERAAGVLPFASYPGEDSGPRNNTVLGVIVSPPDGHA